MIHTYQTCYKWGQVTGNFPLLQKYTMFEGQNIQWLRGSPPLDEPDCGYRGDRCINPPSKDSLSATKNSHFLKHILADR